MRYTLCRRFHNWKPGKLYTPTPLREVDLQHVYNERLNEAVNNNSRLLSETLKVRDNPLTIVDYLLRRHSKELKKVVAQRAEAPKSPFTPSTVYAAFLRQLYSPKISAQKLRAALSRFPEAQNAQQAKYIESTHLETLVSRTLDNHKCFPMVFQILQNAGLPVTSREIATNVLHMALNNQRGNWREVLAQSWSRILEAEDTGTLNILLKLAFLMRCSSTQSLIQYHLNPIADRFTYLIRLRHQQDSTPQEIMQEFQSNRFTTDIVAISAYMSSLLRSGRPKVIEAAEAVFDKIVHASAGLTITARDPNKLGNCLTALDTVSQILKTNNIELPIIADSRLYEHMYRHYVYYKKHQKAINTLIQMAKQGYTPTRLFVIYHIRLLVAEEARNPEAHAELHRLFYLCCDINMAHPGFISPTLLLEWAKAISNQTGTTLEASKALAAKNSSVLPSFM